jgi:translation initiation factor IF-2
VNEGKIARGNLVRLLRDHVVVFEGKLASLKRFKDDVREVAAGYECGLSLEGFQDIKQGDVIEAYERIPVVRRISPTPAGREARA